MEDQGVLKAVIHDSIQEMKDSISKDLTEFRSMLLEVLGEKAKTSFEPQNTIMDVELWQFRGDNPEAWIVQAEHYFDFYKIQEDQKLTVVSFYLDGESLKWYQWLFRNNQLIDWPHFVDKVRIRFKQKGYDFVEGRFPNLRQVTYVSDYQNHCVDVLSSFGESDVLFSGYAYAHPRGSNITHSLLPQYHAEQIECKSNTNACKVFDELPDKYKDANPLGTSSKPNELPIPPNDLVNFVSQIVVVNGCNDDAKNEDKDGKEEIVTNRDEPVEFVIANADKPSLWINSTVSIPCDLSIFDIHQVLNNCWNQLFVGHLKKVFRRQLAQRWEETPSIPSTYSFAKLINRVITDHLCGLSHVALIFTLRLFPPDQFGLEFPFDLCSSLKTMFLRVTRNSVFCLVPDKFTMSTLWNPYNWFDTGQDAPLLIFGDARRKYICSFKSNHNEQSLFNFTINCSSLFSNLRMGCSQYATRCAEELQPSDILMQADSGGTNISPVAGSNHFWFCLRPTTQDLALVTLEPLSSYSTVTGGQTLSIEFSVGYSYNASKGPYIAWKVHLLVLYISFDVKHEDQCDCCYKEVVLSMPWSPLLSFTCMQNERCIADCYPKKTRVKLFLPSNLVEQMIVLRIIFITAESFSLSVLSNHDPTQESVEILAILGSSPLPGIGYMPPGDVVKNLQVPLPSIRYHIARNLHKTDISELSFSGKLFYESVIISSLVWLYSNLEDKVLNTEGGIVVNTDSPKTGQTVGPWAKPQTGPRIRQPNNSFAWDPG